MYGLGADISLPPCRIGGNLSHSMSDLHAALAPHLEELLTDSCFFFCCCCCCFPVSYAFRLRMRKFSELDSNTAKERSEGTNSLPRFFFRDPRW